MQPLTPEARRLVREDKPEFLALVQKAREESRRRKKRPVLRLTLDAFHDDPMHLYVCLWFAVMEGVEVHVLPATT